MLTTTVVKVMTMRSNEWYGWRPDLPDHRDLKYTLGVGGVVVDSLPQKVDLSLTGYLPPIFDQGELGSCTANALAALFFFADKKSGDRFAFLPSRLFIYYNERVIEGTVNEDSGAQLRDGIKAIVDQGTCNEALWPYDIAKFAVKPSEIAYTSAKQHAASVYRRVNQNLSDMKSCLAEGFPFVGGISVFDSFESDEIARTGVVPMPQTTERLQGGHAITFVGYDDVTQTFQCQNSWGRTWGSGGFFTLPYAYVTNPDLATDFWMVHSVTAPIV